MMWELEKIGLVCMGFVGLKRVMSDMLRRLVRCMLLVLLVMSMV